MTRAPASGGKVSDLLRCLGRGETLHDELVDSEQLCSWPAACVDTPSQVTGRQWV